MSRPSRVAEKRIHSLLEIARRHWEAVDLHYWATTDYEWYDPDAVTTKGGNLEITMTQQPNHDLNFRSALLQSWSVQEPLAGEVASQAHPGPPPRRNKVCFTGGYIEAGEAVSRRSQSQIQR